MICELLILFNGGALLLVVCMAMLFHKELRLAVKMATVMVHSQMGTPPSAIQNPTTGQPSKSKAIPTDPAPARRRIKFSKAGA